MKKPLALAVLLMFCLALLPHHAAQAQEDDCTMIGGVYDAERERCVFTVGLDIQIDLPLDVKADYPMMAEALDEIVNTNTSTFLQYFAESAMLYATPPWSLYMQYAVYQQTPATPTEFSPEIVSVVYSIYSYTGGANGSGFYQTLVYDVTNQLPLTLDDVLVEGYLPALSALVREKLLVQLADMSDQTFIDFGAGEDPNNFRSFALTQDELIFFFDEYQVAPGAAGPQELHIPLAELTDLIQPMYVPIAQ